MIQWFALIRNICGAKNRHSNPRSQQPQAAQASVSSCLLRITFPRSVSIHSVIMQKCGSLMGGTSNKRTWTFSASFVEDQKGRWICHGWLPKGFFAAHPTWGVVKVCYIQTIFTQSSGKWVMLYEMGPTDLVIKDGMENHPSISM